MTDTPPHAIDSEMALIDHMNDAVAVVDSDGRIVTVNRRLKEVLPGDQTFVGRPSGYLADQLTDEESAKERYRETLDRVLDANGPVDEYVTLPLTLGAQQVDIEFRLTPILEDGESLGAVVVARDVTERRQLREQLVYLHQILRHDLRNDLAVIQGWAESLQSDGSSENDDAVDRILSAVNHGTEITESARDLVKAISRQDQHYELSPVSLNDALEGELDHVATMYPEADIAMTDEPPEISVRADVMLSSVFRNLLVNAIIHNDAESPTVRVGVDRRGESVTVTVADNGPGIPDSQIESIFERYTKGAESAGAGVGLSLVMELVSLYDGSITVTDNEPTGAVFTVELPTADRQ